MIRSSALVVGVLVAGVATVGAQSPPPPPAPPVVVEDLGSPVAVRLFSDRQAKRGQNTYKKNCSSCHNTQAYTGLAFRRAWVGRSAFELWEQIRTTMPGDSPGRLKPGEYADIVAYLLKLNGYPDGEEELPAEADALRQTMIAPLPPPGN